MRLTKHFAGLAAITLMLSIVSIGAASAYDAEFDYNEDGVVDQADIDILNSHFGYGEGDEGYVAAFDHDGDGMVGGTDVVQALAAVDDN